MSDTTPRYYVYRDTLLFDTTEHLDSYLTRNSIATQNMLSLTGHACVDGIHKRIRSAPATPLKFAAPTPAERTGDGTRLLPQFSNCLFIGQQYHDALAEYELLRQQVANVVRTIFVCYELSLQARFFYSFYFVPPSVPDTVH